MVGDRVEGAASLVRDHEDQSTYVVGGKVERVANWTRGTEGSTNYVASKGVEGANSGSEALSQPTLAVEVLDWLKAARPPVY